MIEQLFDAIEVEVVADVLFVDFTEELVILEVAEPTDPADALLWTVALWFAHLVCFVREVYLNLLIYLLLFVRVDFNSIQFMYYQFLYIF